MLPPEGKAARRALQHVIAIQALPSELLVKGAKHFEIVVQTNQARPSIGIGNPALDALCPMADRPKRTGCLPSPRGLGGLSDPLTSAKSNG